VNLVPRYVQAVKRYLPASIREDAATELTSILEDKLADAEDRKNAPLTEAEVEQMLREFGHPYKVAVGYFPIPNLVSQRAYPLYRRALAFSLIAHFLVVLEVTLFRIARYDGSWALALVPSFLGDVINALLVGFLLITVVFHYLGDLINSTPWVWRWSPSKLPQLDEPWANILISGTFISIITAVCCLALLTATGYGFSLGGVSIDTRDIAVPYFNILRYVLMLQILLYVANLAQRYWTRLKLTVFAVLAVAVAACLVRLALMPDLLVLSTTIPDNPAERQFASELFVRWPLLLIRIALLVIAGKALYDAGVAFSRILKKKIPSW
jgi:hypothetical protein